MKAISEIKQSLKTTKEVLRLVWQTSSQYTVYIVLILTVSAIMPIVEAYFIKKVIDNLTSPLHQKIAFSVILFYLILFISATVISRVIESLRTSTQIVFGNLFAKEINNRIVEKTTKLEYSKFEDPVFYDKLERTRDHASWKPLNAFYHLFGGLRYLITFVSIVAVIFTFSPWIVLLMIIFTIPSLYVQIKFGDAWWNLLHSETTDSRRAHYLQYLMTNRHEMKDIKLLNLRNNLLDKYNALYNKLFNEQKKVIIRKYAWELITYLFSDIILVLFYLYLAWQTYLQKYSIGDFTFFSTMYLNGVRALHGFVIDISGVYENNLFISEVVEFLEMEEESGYADNSANPNIRSKKKIPLTISEIEFRDVWFKYPGTEKWILNGVSFRIASKHSIALVGENGAGKTTLVKLITRLYLPTKGEILVNGINVDEYSLDDYRNLIGVAFQDFAKFQFSLDENIRMGDIKRKLSSNEIIVAAKKAHIHKKAISLPKGYKTKLGRWYHEGDEISFGEWQRVAIARALVKDCPLYILDEPTAALDAKAEYLVFEEFKKHVRGRMAVFSSHRFSNVRLADDILVIENGRIIEKGSHNELMYKKGKYHELYNFQADRYK